MTDTIIEEYRDWTIVYNHDRAVFDAIKGKRRLKPDNRSYGEDEVKHAKQRVDGDILAKKRKAARDGKPELTFRHWRIDKEEEIETTLVSYTNRGFKTAVGMMKIEYRDRNLLVIPKLFSTGRLHRAVEGLRLATAEMSQAIAQATTVVRIQDCRGGTPEEYADVEDTIRNKIIEAS